MGRVSLTLIVKLGTGTPPLVFIGSSTIAVFEVTSILKFSIPAVERSDTLTTFSRSSKLIVVDPLFIITSAVASKV